MKSNRPIGLSAEPQDGTRLAVVTPIEAVLQILRVEI
jgi:hypothetical protein